MSSDTFVITKGAKFKITIGALGCLITLIWLVASWMGDIRYELRGLRKEVNNCTQVQKEISVTLAHRFESQTELKARVIILEREIISIKRSMRP